ncbi:MAG: (d)CMP kinase [Ruminococcus sp.]
MKTTNIAIDGPAGAGKSSIAREISSELGFIYVDTGALYRTIALYASIHNLSSEKELIDQLDEIEIELSFIGGIQRISLCGKDVTDDIRTPEISMGASKVSAIPEVREFLFDLQQKIAREHNVIMDGRDIGTVVLPDADLKIFLTASADERASRRYLELKEKADCPTYEEIRDDIIKRDYNDSHRAIAPLRQAEDAVLIDTTDMGFHEVCEEILSLIRERLELED